MLYIYICKTVTQIRLTRCIIRNTDICVAAGCAAGNMFEFVGPRCASRNEYVRTSNKDCMLTNNAQNKRI